MNISVEDTIKGLQQNHIQSSTLDYEFGILCDHTEILRISKALELEETYVHSPCGFITINQNETNMNDHLSVSFRKRTGMKEPFLRFNKSNQFVAGKSLSSNVITSKAQMHYDERVWQHSFSQCCQQRKAHFNPFLGHKHSS